MFLSLVKRNLEAARQAQKKDSPKTALFVFILAALFGLNAFGLFVTGRGIILRSLGPELCGVLSAIVCAFGIFYGVKFLIDAAKSRNKNATAQRMEQFMGAVRAVGPEDEVFAELDGLTPYVFSNGELRFDEKLIAGTSATKVENNYIYPLQALTAAGLTVLGGQVNLYLHMTSGKKVRKHSYIVSEKVGNVVLDELNALQPSLKVQRLGGKK